MSSSWRGVVAPQPARVHLALEERGAAVEPRAQDHRELVAQDRAALQRFPADEAHEVGALLEEAERGAHDPLDLRPAFARALGRLVDEAEPVGERLEQHRAVQRFFRREVVQQARGGGSRPRSAISVRLVPAYPCSAKR